MWEDLQAEPGDLPSRPQAGGMVVVCQPLLASCIMLAGDETGRGTVLHLGTLS